LRVLTRRNALLVHHLTRAKRSWNQRLAAMGITPMFLSYSLIQPIACVLFPVTHTVAKSKLLGVDVICTLLGETQQI
jgi:hypothetical protein